MTALLWVLGTMVGTAVIAGLLHWIEWWTMRRDVRKRDRYGA